METICVSINRFFLRFKCRADCIKHWGCCIQYWCRYWYSSLWHRFTGRTPCKCIWKLYILKHSNYPWHEPKVTNYDLQHLINILQWLLCYFHLFSVLGRIGACVRCAIFGAKSQLQSANHNSQFAGVSGWNIANDIITTHVSVNWFQWRWFTIRLGFPRTPEQSKFKSIWCHLSNLRKRYWWAWQCFHQIKGLSTIFH